MGKNNFETFILLYRSLRRNQSNVEVVVLNNFQNETITQ